MRNKLAMTETINEEFNIERLDHRLCWPCQLWLNREDRDYDDFMHFKCVEFYNKSFHDMMIITVYYPTYSSQST